MESHRNTSCFTSEQQLTEIDGPGGVTSTEATIIPVGALFSDERRTSSSSDSLQQVVRRVAYRFVVTQHRHPPSLLLAPCCSSQSCLEFDTELALQTLADDLIRRNEAAHSADGNGRRKLEVCDDGFWLITPRGGGFPFYGVSGGAIPLPAT